MATTIKLKNSVTTTNAPSSLVQGEVAINITDKKVWVGNAATTPIQLLGAGASGTFGALTCTSLTNSGLTSGRVTYASTGGLLADSANFTFNGTTVTMANDASISGLTVGKGSGSVATNTAIGSSALNANTTATRNTGVGYRALYVNTASLNAAFGDEALVANTTGTQNTAVGSQAGLAITTGSNNTAIGRVSMYANTITGDNNTGVGAASLLSLTSGANNTGIGHSALYSNTTASNNTAVGYQAGYSNTTGGIQAFGRVALYSNTTGVNNAGFGNQALFSNTTGGFNTAFGDESLRQNTTASNNTAVGYQAGYSTTTAGGNVFVGHQAGYTNTTGSYNTFVGQGAGHLVTTGVNNTCLGQGAGYATTTGSYNTFVGPRASTNYGAGELITTGSKNTVLGGYSGNQGGLDIRTLSNRIVISDGDGNPRIYVNDGGEVIVGGVTDQGAYNLQCNGTAVWGAGAYVNGSDARIKENITPLDSGLDVIAKLNPVTYKYKETWSKDQSIQTGFIAQELLEALKDKTYVDGVVQQNSDYMSVAYQNIIPILVKAMQELKQEFDDYKASHP